MMFVSILVMLNFDHLVKLVSSRCVNSKANIVSLWNKYVICEEMLWIYVNDLVLYRSSHNLGFFKWPLKLESNFQKLRVAISILTVYLYTSSHFSLLPRPQPFSPCIKSLNLSPQLFFFHSLPLTFFVCVSLCLLPNLYQPSALLATHNL